MKTRTPASPGARAMVLQGDLGPCYRLFSAYNLIRRCDGGGGGPSTGCSRESQSLKESCGRRWRGSGPTGETIRVLGEHRGGRRQALRDGRRLTRVATTESASAARGGTR